MDPIVNSVRRYVLIRTSVITATSQFAPAMPSAAPAIAATVSLSRVSFTDRTRAWRKSCPWRINTYSTLGTVSNR